MTEAAEGGAVLAWRLLATLEGGSLLLATSALLAYSARKRLARMKRIRRPINSVLLTNSTNTLGQELKSQLESSGCVVRTASGVATNDAFSSSMEGTNRVDQVDALIIVGAHSSVKPASLQTMANLVSEDVYNNLRTLESLSVYVKRGGCIAWACAGAATDGNFQGAGEAFDTVLRANLQRIAQLSECEAVWVGRADDAHSAAQRVTTALLTGDHNTCPGFSIRNAAHKIGDYIGRWLKIVT